nr:MAG TPA: hypothetical protein [Caudoviricetes sp.]
MLRVCFQDCLAIYLFSRFDISIPVSDFINCLIASFDFPLYM